MNLNTKRKDPPGEGGCTPLSNHMEAARIRSQELGHLAGRESHEVCQADYEQAKKEQSLVMEPIPEVKRPVHWEGPVHPHLPQHGKAERAEHPQLLSKQGSGGFRTKSTSTQPMKLWRRKQG